MRRALGVDEQDTRWEKNKRGYSGGFGHAAMYRPCKGEVDFKNYARGVYQNDTIPLTTKILSKLSVCGKFETSTTKALKISKKALICEIFQNVYGKILKSVSL